MDPRQPSDRPKASGARLPKPDEPLVDVALTPAAPVPQVANVEFNAVDRGTVLLVDDDEALRRALRRLLTSHGFRVLAFGSAEEFLEAETSAEHGCLLLDLRMGGMSGLGVQATLAERGDTRPIVFLTGHATARTKEMALAQGAIGFLEKPAREHELLAMLDRALARS